MRLMLRYLSILTSALVLFTCASDAQAKRYIVKRDPKTGKTTLVDPNESRLSKLTKPIIKPIVRPLVKAKTLIAGRPAPQARGQLKGFGPPMYQGGMQEPTGLGPRTADAAARTIEATGSTVAGQTGKDLVGLLTRPFRKAFGGTQSRSQADNRGAGAGR